MKPYFQRHRHHNISDLAQEVSDIAQEVGDIAQEVHDIAQEKPICLPNVYAIILLYVLLCVIIVSDTSFCVRNNTVICFALCDYCI